MIKNKKKESIVILEMSITADDKFEIKLQKIDKTTIPIIVGLLEKVKFNLLSRDYDDDDLDEEEHPTLNMFNKYES
jgi:hypothetical protein